VHADEGRADLKRALHLRLVVDFDERGEPERRREEVKLLELLPFEERRDQKDGVRAEPPRLSELVLVEDEVLHEKPRLGKSRSDVGEKLGAPVEKLGLGEDRQ